ncbi:MAG TPA: hypothetical protein VF538_03850 [Pyrinomonadaceae bacterium]
MESTRMNQRLTNSRSLRPTSAIILALSVSAPLLFAACADKRGRTEVTAQTPTPAQAQNTNATEAAQAPSPAAPATPAPKPPQASEVSDKLARIFQGAVQIDAARGGAVVGDFNGDGSEDVAVAVKPAADKIEEINSEVANWILGDPQRVAAPDPKETVRRLPAEERVKINAGDALLAVVHGYEQGGWRNPAAQQSYLLKNPAGRSPRVESKQDAAGEFKAITTHLHGDIIREDAGGTPGFVYWTGGKYAWFAPRGKTR